MATARQQRAPRNRRVVSVEAPPVLPTPVPSLVSVSGHELTLQFTQYRNPALPPGSIIPIQLIGIPSVVRLLDNTLPTAALLLAGETQVRLTYGGGNLGATENFRTSPRDPSLRTSTGGFTACTTLVQAAGPINLYNFTVALSDPVTVVITYGNPGIPVVFDPLKFRHVNSGNFPTSLLATSSTSLTAIYPAPVTSGDDIRYDGADINASPVTALSFDHSLVAVP